MLVAIPRNVYFRTYGQYGYLFNQRTWSSALIEDPGQFKLLFTRHPANVDLVVKQIARECDINESIVRSDVDEIIRPLITDGYLVAGSSVEYAQGWTSQPNECGKRVRRGGTVKDAEDFDDRENATQILNKFFLKHPTPFELCIDLTRACTERCIHCYVPGFQNIFLPYENIEKVLAEFASMGGLKVKLTGGECMLHPDFEKFLALARANDMVISVLSNLTCCDAMKANAIKAADVAVVQVSLYGMTPETHESVTRVKGSLSKTLQGIDLLHKIGVPVQIHCPVLRQNVSGIDAVAEFGRTRSMKTTFDAVMMSRADHGCAGDYGLSDDELSNFITANEDLSGNLSACPEIDPNERVCEIGSAKICLSAEGKYYPCNGCYGYVLGDCKSQTLSDVWRGEPIRRLRELRMRDLPSCLSCRNRFLCSPCPARNFNANGDLTIPDAAMCRAANCRSKMVESKK